MKTNGEKITSKRDAADMLFHACEYLKRKYSSTSDLRPWIEDNPIAQAHWILVQCRIDVEEGLRLHRTDGGRLRTADGHAPGRGFGAQRTKRARSGIAGEGLTTV